MRIRVLLFRPKLFVMIKIPLYFALMITVLFRLAPDYTYILLRSDLAGSFAFITHPSTHPS
jgi:hypothetical protein